MTTRVLITVGKPCPQSSASVSSTAAAASVSRGASVTVTKIAAESISFKNPKCNDADLRVLLAKLEEAIEGKRVVGKEDTIHVIGKNRETEITFSDGSVSVSVTCCVGSGTRIDYNVDNVNLGCFFSGTVMRKGNGFLVPEYGRMWFNCGTEDEFSIEGFWSGHLCIVPDEVTIYNRKREVIFQGKMPDNRS